MSANAGGNTALLPNAVESLSMYSSPTCAGSSSSGVSSRSSVVSQSSSEDLIDNHFKQILMNISENLEFLLQVAEIPSAKLNKSSNAG